MFLEHKEAVEITPAKVLKLSEAIRIGAKIRPQCTYSYFTRGKSCALGAAAEALYGVTEKTFSTTHINKITSKLSRVVVSEIIERNDDLHWTREQIADWLEGQGY